MTTSTHTSSRPGKILGPALWLVQALLALFYIYAGITKLSTPPAELAKMMPWTAALPQLVTLTGMVDLLGGLGVLLPSLTRIQPRLTAMAALGTIVLQTLAMTLHLSRGETMVVPMNLVLIALAAFVFWGRGRALPIASR
ncbi:hypothetical protein CHU94_03465 [Rhodoferax sp. TH121]|uniref:DoxX family protein n=1 Tax=Rhodoferax sp. TH121 TaxID=2022803 RepID=UPI000B95DB83|nr:DoxX family protein [Rhodoferax sp. TH121]OYQ42199.1 hypothetical protein CHU94_03465 [Rhodoferax sp. TH121]